MYFLKPTLSYTPKKGGRQQNLWSGDFLQVKLESSPGNSDTPIRAQLSLLL
jgi:hypothetical protein